MVVGSAPDASILVPAALQVQPHQVRLVLDGLEGLVQRLHLAADQEMALLSTFKTSLSSETCCESSIGRADSATGSRTR